MATYLQLNNLTGPGREVLPSSQPRPDSLYPNQLDDSQQPITNRVKDSLNMVAYIFYLYLDKTSDGTETSKNTNLQKLNLSKNEIQYLSNPEKAKEFAKNLYSSLKNCLNNDLERTSLIDDLQKIDDTLSLQLLDTMSNLPTVEDNNSLTDLEPLLQNLKNLKNVLKDYLLIDAIKKEAQTNRTILGALLLSTAAIISISGGMILGFLLSGLLLSDPGFMFMSLALGIAFVPAATVLVKAVDVLSKKLYITDKPVPKDTNKFLENLNDADKKWVLNKMKDPAWVIDSSFPKIEYNTEYLNKVKENDTPSFFDRLFNRKETFFEVPSDWPQDWYNEYVLKPRESQNRVQN